MIERTARQNTTACPIGAGFPAWLLWALVHIASIVGFRNRLRVLFNWFVAWLLDSHDASVITDGSRIHVHKPRGPGFERTKPDAPDSDSVPASASASATASASSE